MALDIDKLLNGDISSSLDTSHTTEPKKIQQGSDKQKFLSDYAPVFQRVGNQLGVNPNMIAAQLGIETGWGKHIIGGTNNLGNIKDFTGGGVAAKDNMLGSVDKYRQFNTVDDFADHYSSLLSRKFPNVLGSGEDVKQFAKGLHGFAQDPKYADKIINTFNSLEGIQSKQEHSPFTQSLTDNVGDVLRKEANDRETLGDAAKHGFKTTIKQLPQLGGGALAFLGDTVGNDWLKQTGLDIYNENSAEISAESKGYEDLATAQQNGDFGKWMAYAGGYSVGQISQAIVTGGIGALVAKTGAKNLFINTAEKAAAEYIEQTAAKAVIKFEAEAIAKGMEANAVKSASSKIYKNTLSDPKVIATGQEAGKAAQSLAVSKFGVALGMGANSEMMEIGQIYPEAYEQAQKEGRDVDLVKVMGAATGAASLDLIPEMRIGNKLLSPAERLVEGAAKNTQHGLLGRLAREIPKQSVLEGGTEALQTPIEAWGAGKDPFTQDGWRDIINSAAMGAVGGVIGGGIAAIPKTPEEVKKESFTPNSPLSNASNAGTPVQPQHPSNGFGDQRLDQLHSDIVSYISDRNNIAALRQAGKNLPDEAMYVWTNVINNQNLPLATRSNALEQAHSMMMNLPNFTFGSNAEPQSTAVTVPNQTGIAAYNPETPIQHDTIDGDFINHERTINRTGVQETQPFTEREQSTFENSEQPISESAASETKAISFADEKDKVNLDSNSIPNALTTMHQTSAVKRHDAIRGLVGQGFITIDKDNNLTNPKTGHKLPLASPADIQVARQSIRKQVDAKAHEAASSPNNDLPIPTKSQIEAENYKKGHVNIHGIDIAVENPKGSTRSGVDKDGNAWESTLAHHYGYVKGTTGADGDAVDVFIGHNPASSSVFIIDQKDPSTGKFDEHKVMLGFNSEEEASKGYHENYDDNWKGHGAITEMTVDEFKKWIKSGSKSPVSLVDGRETSAQYKNYDKWIDDNDLIPSGMLEQINVDERLNDGEASQLVAKAKAKNAINYEAVLDGNNVNKESDEVVSAQSISTNSKVSESTASRHWIRPHIEALIKDKADANEMGNRRQLDKIVELAKQYMNGEDVNANKFKSLSVSFASHDKLKGAINSIYDGIKLANKENKATSKKAKVTIEDVKNVIATSTSEENVIDTPEIQEQKVSREVQRQLFNRVSNSDAAINTVAKGEEKYYESAKKLVASEISRMSHDGDIGNVSIDNLPSEFWNALYRKSKRLAQLSEKAKNQDPELYKQQLAKSAVEASINMDDPAYLDNFKEGFDHALKGKSKSTLTTGLVDLKQRGYEAAWRWVQTDEGKAWYEGKRRTKLQNTGADLRRWFEQASYSIKNLPDSDPVKVYESVKKLTERAKVFSVDLDPEATNGTKLYADKLRSKVRTFNDFITTKGALSDLYGETWRKTEEQLVLGFLNGKAYFTRKVGEDNINSQTFTPEERSGLLKAAAIDWMNNVKQVTDALAGSKSVDDISAKFTNFYQDSEGKATPNGSYFYSKLTVRGFYASQFLTDGYYTNELKRIEDNDIVNNRAKPLTPPRLDRITRIGLTDHRNGQDVTPQDLKDTFNFADVGFGGYVSTKQDQDHINYTYDAFMDLSELLGIESTDIGFGGSLYFTIGALGHGKYAAHFAHGQPHPNGGSVEVINITNTKGDGTLAHEWFHALDYYLGNGNMSSNYGVRLLVDALSRKYDIENLMQVPKKFLESSWTYKLGKNATKLDHAKYAIEKDSYGRKVQTSYKKEADLLGEKYWGNEKELLARAAEAWVFDALEEKRNNYLVSDWVEDGYVTKEKGYRGTPYPRGEERTRFKSVFNQFIKHLTFTDGKPTINGSAFYESLAGDERDFEQAKKDLIARLPSLYKEIQDSNKERRLLALANQNSYAEPSVAAEELKRREQLRLQAEAEATVSTAELPQSTVTEGPLSDDELNSIFDDAENELTESTQESVNTQNMGDAIVTKHTASDEPTQESVSQLLVQAAKLGLTGMDESLTGLMKLFGGGDNGRLNSFPSGFDEDAYQKARPHFKAALASAEQLGLTLQELFKRLIQLFGAGIRPYAIQFAKDEGLGASLGKKENYDATSDEKQTGNDDRVSNEESSASDVSGTESGEQATGSDTEQGRRSGSDLRDDAERTENSDTGNTESGLSDTSSDVESSQEPVLRDSSATSNGVSTRGNNYLAISGSLTREGSWRDTASRNLDIVELVKKLNTENRLATPEEQALLAKFTGWGASEIRNNLFSGQSSGTSRILNPFWAKPDWRDLVQRAKDLLTPEEVETAMQSTQYAHYTSERVIRSIWAGLSRMGFNGGRMLEGGSGIGLFALAAPKNIIDNSKYTGIEMDVMSAEISKQLLQNESIINGDFVKQKLPNGFFDLAIGNPPFSSIRIKDDPAYKKYGFTLHDYFFAKSIDKVRDGGILAFVTSKGTMDKVGDKARQYLAERADLLGAIRLPQTAFKDNAGTEVITDVIFLRKRAEGEAETANPWMNLAEITTDNGTKFMINEYFVNHPEMVLGTHSTTSSAWYRSDYTVAPLSGDIEGHFEKAIENLPAGIYTQFKPVDAIKSETIERDFNPKADKEGSVYLSDKGVLMRREYGSGVPLESIMKMNDRELSFMKDYVGLRDAIKQAQLDQLTDGDWESSLKKLNKVYDKFVKDNGKIVDFTTYERTSKDEDGNDITTEYKRYKNNKLLRADVEGTLIEALERITEDGDIVKSPFLNERTIKKHVRPEINGLNDALMVSLDEVGKLNLDHVAELAKMEKEEVISTLGDLIYESPNGGWQMSDEYLSGDVLEKLYEAEAAARIDERFERNVKALLLAQPKPLSHEQIKIMLGANWIPADVITHFANEVMDVNTKVNYNPNTNVWSVDGADGYGSRRNRDSTATYGTPDRSPHEILDDVLNANQIKVTKVILNENGNKSTVTDTSATALANQVADKIRKEFASWIWTDAQRAENISALYNSKFNNIAPREFDGSHLTLAGMSIRYKLHPHQLRAIWRIIQTGNTYLAHAVGAGKTLEMIVSAMEQKRLGLINKPMFVVPNHMLDQFANEFLDAYPTANVMVADEENFHTDNRRRFISQAALNNPDAIIITHSAFGLIKTKQETNNVVVDELIMQLEASLEETDDRRARAKIESRIENIRRKFDSRVSDEAKDQQVTFEELGTDFLYVDEAHEFRKLDFVSNRGTVKGIDPNGSQKALGLFIKMRWLNSQRPNRSGVFASGTPVTNTMAELYTILRYMNPNELEKTGLDHFDAWANMFGEVSSNFEMNAAGKYEVVERFSKFVNIPELMKRVRMTMDVLTSSQLGGLVKRPSIKGGQPETIIVPASKETAKYLSETLAKRIETSKRWKPSPDEKGNPDPLLNIITDGRLSAIDMRFVDRNAANDPASKLNVMIDNIIADHKDNRGIEFIDNISGKKDPIKGATQIIFSAVGFGDQVAKSRGFDAKAWIAQRLKNEAGITNIAFMGDYKTAAKKENLFKDMRSGKVTQLYGSPKNMGTGVNVQKRLKNLYFLSPPWYPADVEQPQGRIERQGNQNSEVSIKWFATKGTYDSTAWSMVSRKARFIEQAFMGDDSVRTMEDVSEASQYEMASALASGDERAIQLAGYKADIERLMQLKQAHANTQIDLRHRKASAEFSMKSYEKSVSIYKEAKKLVGDYIYGDKLTAEIGGKNFVVRAELGEALTKAIDKAIFNYHGTKVEEVEVGKALGKLPIIAEIDADMKMVGNDYTRVKAAKVFVQIGEVRQYLEEEYKSSYVDFDASGFARRLENALNAMDKRQSHYENQIESAKLELKQVTSKIGAPFADEAELSEKIAESAQLEADMLKGDIEVPSDEALLAMKDAKEQEENAKVQEAIKDIHFIKVAGTFTAVHGKDVVLSALPDEKFFIWRDNGSYNVSHSETGLRLSSTEISEEQAIDDANARINKFGEDETLRIIEKNQKINESEKQAAINKFKDSSLESREESPIFYSALTKAVQAFSQEKAAPAQWKGMIANLSQKGIKADEIQWSGINEWLDMQNGQVSRQAILDYLNANGVQVTETMLGDDWLERIQNRMEEINEQITSLVDEHGPIPTMNVKAKEEYNQLEKEYYKLDDDLRKKDTVNDSTKYSQYTVLGGENYKELLLTLPDKSTEPVLKQNENGAWFYEVNGKQFGSIYPTEQDARLNRAREISKFKKEQSAVNYKSSHFDQPNILAHVRFDERTDSEGKKVLFINELQSDWGQDGKKKGFNSKRQYKPLGDTEYNDFVNKMRLAAKDKVRELTQSAMDETTVNSVVGQLPPERLAEMSNMETEWAEIEARNQEDFKFERQGAFVASAPFVTKTDAWVGLAIKRMIRYAADNGFDKVAFISGEQAAGLYDLSKQVKSIYYAKNQDGTFDLDIMTKDDNYIRRSDLSESQLVDNVGEEIADKIVSSEDKSGSFTGLDLKVGGEGMRYFYDNLVPKVAKDVLKKLGGSVDSIKLENLNSYEELVDAGKKTGLSQNELDAMPVGERKALIDSMIPEKLQVGFTITPEMRDAAQEGMPLFSAESKAKTTETPESIRDAFVKAFGGKAIIQLEANNLIEIVTDVSHLPTGLELSKTGIAVFAGNKAYFIADRMTATNAHQALLHEIGEHYGLEKILGVEGYDTLIARVRELSNSDPLVKAAWSFVKRNYPKLSTDSKAFMHEVIAQIGQNADITARPWWKQIIEAAKRFMIKLGFTGMIKVSDIQDMVLHSLNVAADNGTDDNHTKQDDFFGTVALQASKQEDNQFTKAKDQSSAMKLNAGMVKYFNDKDWINAYESQTMFNHFDEATRAIERAFKTTVTAIKPTMERFDQFVGINYAGTNYININSGYGFINTVGHEIYHQLAKDQPDLHDWLVSQAKPYFNNFDTYHARLNSVISNPSEKLTVDEAVEELLADATGDALSDTKFLSVLAQANPSKFKDLLTYVSQFLKTVSDALLGKGLSSAKYINDVNAFQSLLAQALEAYAAGKNIEELHQPKFSIENEPLESRGNFMDGLTMDNIAETAKRNFADAVNSKATFNNWWHKGAGTQYHKAEVDPEHFGKVYNIAQLFIRDLARYANTAADQAPNLLPKMDSVGDAVKGFGTIFRDDKDAKSIAEPIFQGTLNDKVYTDKELTEDFNLNERQIGLYREFRAAVDQSLDDLAISEMGRLAKTQGIPTAPEGLTLDEVTEYYKQHYEGDLEKAQLALNDLKDRQAQENGLLRDASIDYDTEKRVEMLLDMRKRHASELNDAQILVDSFNELNKGIVDKSEKINELKANGYAPLMRFGKYTVDVYLANKDGSVSKNADGEEMRQFFGMFEDEAEANRAARDLQAEYPESTVTQGILSQESASLFKGVTPETVELFARLAGNEQSEAFQKYLKMAVNNRSAMKRLIKRNGIKGFSDNPTRVLAAFITSNARASASNDYFGDMLKATSNIPKHKGDVKDEAIKLMNYIQNPQDESSTLRGLLFMHYLGGSVAAALVNMTQPILMTFPYLHQYSSSAAKHLAWAMKVSSKKLIGKDVSFDDAAMTEALKRAADEGVTSPHEIHMLYGEASRTSGYAGSRIMRNITKVWGGFFAVAEEFNRNATFIAAFKIAQERGLEGEEAYQFCKKAVDETQGVYNKANKPNWARGSIGGVLFTFKQFSISYLEFLKRLPAKERSIALAVLIMASGTQGLPASDDLDDLIDTLMQSLGFNWNTKQEKMDFVAKLIGKDAAGYVTHGISNGLPIDLSGRLGAGNLLPATALLKKSESDKTRDVSEFFGASGAFLTNYVAAFNQIQNRNFIEAAKLVSPKAISDIAKGIDMLETGEAHDSKGRKVADVTTLDAAIRMIGFNPTHLAQGSRDRSMLIQNSNLLKETQSNIKEIWSQGIAQGDKDKISAAKSELDRWNKNNPESKITIKLSDIQRKAAAMRQSANERFIKSAPKQLRKGVTDVLNE